MRLGEADLTIQAENFLPEMGLRHKFNPCDMSMQEREFLLDHLEDSPAKALKGYDPSVPHNPSDPQPRQSVNQWCVEHPGVNPQLVREFLQRLRDAETTDEDVFGFYERDPNMAKLIEKKPHEQFRGIQAIRMAILDSLEYERRFQQIKNRDIGAALHPSMHTKDARGRLHFQGPGSDRGRVRKFTAWIVHKESGRVAQDWADAAASEHTVVEADEVSEKATGAGADFSIIEGENYFECPVKDCNFRASFDPNDDGDRRKKRANLMRHMAMATDNVDDHREAKVFNA